jgi:hypothetical protein
MSEQNKMLIRRAIEKVWNQGNFAVNACRARDVDAANGRTPSLCRSDVCA